MLSLPSPVFLALVAGLLAVSSGAPPEANSPQELGWMDLEELLQVRIVSAGLQGSKAFQTPAATAVLTQDDIRLSPATNLPELLRLASGAEVGFVNSRNYAVSIRGFNGISANKLLPMIDGRSLYSLRFGGTIWELRDLLLEDVERIEVIRGPGGAAWGSNAVNGIINVITQNSRDTQGTLLRGGVGGFEEASLAARHGFQTGPNRWLRVYGQAFRRGHSSQISGPPTPDCWRQFRTGFRADGQPSRDFRYYVSGDFFHSEADQILLNQMSEAVSFGGHLLGFLKWDFPDHGDLEVQAYYDGFSRDSSGIESTAQVFDLKAKHRLARFGSHQIHYGADGRLNLLEDRATSPAAQTLSFADPSLDVVSGSVFIEDSIAQDPLPFSAVLGARLEYHDFSGTEFLPNFRLGRLWAPELFTWAGVSRAARIPARVDYEAARQPAPIQTNPELEREILESLETGLRWKPSSSWLLDLSLYYHAYSRLFLAQTTPTINPVGFFTQTINGGEGTAYGSEAALTWDPTARLRLRAHYSFLEMDLADTAGQPTTDLTVTMGSSPRHQAGLQVSWQLHPQWECGLHWRYVDRLPARAISAYQTADAALLWSPRRDLQWTLAAQNLFEPVNQEFAFFTSRWGLPRHFYLKVTWTR